MKKLLALILALAMILTLAACAGDPIDTTPENEEPNESTSTEPEKTEPTEPKEDTIYLVESYEANMGNLATWFDSYRMEFEYNDELTGGSVTMTANDITEQGTFTCDENYNINHICVENMDEGHTLTFEMRFDDSHRLLSAVITLANATESELLYSIEYTYNDQGQRTRLASNFPRFDLKNTYLCTYDDNGNLLEETTITSSNGIESCTKNIWSYDADGILSGLSICDGEGNVVGDLKFTHETVDGMIICAADMDGTTMKIGFDQWGNTALVEMSAGGQILSKNESTFDENGNVLSTTSTSPDHTNHIEYTYDEAGHLTSMRQTTNGETHYVTTTYITVKP